MTFKKRKQALVFTMAFAAVCTSAAFVPESRVMAAITAEDTIIDHTTDSAAGEVSLPDQEQLKQLDEERQGVITVQLTDGQIGSTRGGIRFYCIKAAEVKAGEYVLQKQFEDVQVDLNALENAEDLKNAAEQLTKKVEEKDRSAETDENGKVVFSDLETGVYLIYAESTEKYDAIEPSLIAVPTWSDTEGQMQYEVSVEPKHSAKIGTLKVTAPKSSAPQTGIQDYTVYYLAGGAGCVALAGILVAADKKKKKKDEQ